MTGSSVNKLRIALVAGEASGDHLGAALMDALVNRAPACEFFGVGGPEMEARGLNSCFQMDDIAVMGPLAIMRQLPRIARRLYQAVNFIVDRQPDILVIIDCPEFSHRVARRARARMSSLPVIDYVAPSVWAWRSGRAREMRGFVDQVMALLPFEPGVFSHLGGPPCNYVGHPAVENGTVDEARIAALRTSLEPAGRPVLAVMPGSRRSELKRLCRPFRDALSILASSSGPIPVVMPTLPRLRSELERETMDWPLHPMIVSEPEDRRAAMTIADAAIVASGTATLELALARTPMVVGYRTEPVVAFILPVLMRHASVRSFVLANLVHGDTPVPALFQGECTGVRLAECIAPLLVQSKAREAQLAALDLIATKVTGDGTPPSNRAAQIVLGAVNRTSIANADA